MYAPLPEYPAKTHARYLASLLQRTGFLDFDHDRSIPISRLFERGEGRMIGVLTAIDGQGDEVLLKAFSGTIGTQRSIEGWAPHPMDEHVYRSYLAEHDPLIKAVGSQIESADSPAERLRLERLRSDHSRAALAHYNRLFTLTGIDGIPYSLSHIFANRPIPTGSGECCAPKLLSWAFSNNLRPTSMAEFYFGSSANGREHARFYPPCTERCAPILTALLGLSIRYRDHNLIVVDKKSGLLSVPGSGPLMQDSVETRIRVLYPDAPLQCAAHRLDMDTSGLIIVALHRKALSWMHQEFRTHRVIRHYEALLEGIVPHKEGVITLPFRADITNRPYQVYDEAEGKWGTTHFKRLGVEKRPDGSFVTRMHFTPTTGRTHQIRLHAAHPKGLGHPILGDRLYGSGMTDRLYLHAKKIRFTGVEGTEPITVHSTPPF